jgi:hypothetical protein
MVEMAEQQVRNIGGVDVNSHQLPRRSMAAIDQEMAAVGESDEDRSMAAFRVRQRSASPKHDDLHSIVPFS